MKKNLRHAVEHYLATRRSFGFAFVKDGFELRGLVRYAERIGYTGPLTQQIQREGDDIAGTTAVARAQPEPGDQLGLLQHRQERM